MSLSVSLRHQVPGFALDVDFTAPQGVTVLFGRSGSGKTTIVRAVAGLLRPEAGRMHIGDRMLFDHDRGVNLPPHRRRVGYVFQDARLFPHLSVAGNLDYGRRLAPRDRPRADRSRIIDMLGIRDLLERRPAALSGGERQRVAIGRALLSAPELLLADEPLAALDEARKGEILPYFEMLRDELNVPVLYVSHSASEVARLATTVVVLDRGRIVRQGSAADVLSDPLVTPAGVRGVGAVLEARVVAHHPDGLSELDANGVPLFLPRVAKAVGAPLRVRIGAQEVMLALSPPQNISALNVIPGVVEAIREGGGPGTIVTLRTAAGPILVRITARSAGRLQLATGVTAHAIVKSLGIAPSDVGGAGALR